jgi:hypothetical protein
MKTRKLEDNDLRRAGSHLAFDASADVCRRAEETIADAFFGAAILLQRELHRPPLHVWVVMQEQVSAAQRISPGLRPSSRQ